MSSFAMGKAIYQNCSWILDLVHRNIAAIALYSRKLFAMANFTFTKYWRMVIPLYSPEIWKRWWSGSIELLIHVLSMFMKHSLIDGAFSMPAVSQSPCPSLPFLGRANGSFTWYRRRRLYLKCMMDQYLVLCEAIRLEFWGFGTVNTVVQLHLFLLKACCDWFVRF